MSSMQQQNEDLVNGMSLVSTIKLLIQKLWDDGWEPLLQTVKVFLAQNNIDIHDFKAQYTRAYDRSHHQSKVLTSLEHHFKVDIFVAAINFQLQELNNRSCDQTIELLILISLLCPQDSYSLFNVDDVCNLAEKFYPKNFSEQKKLHLRF